MFQPLLKMLGWNAPPAPVPPRIRTRDPRNAPGDFYVEEGCCMTCGLAEAETPDLIASVYDVDYCYFKKQPTMPEELEQAVQAMFVSEVACHRYGGKDAGILRRLKAEGLEAQCDFPLAE